MTCYAFYRLPYSDSYTAIESDTEPLVLSSVDDIGRESGFVVAPFTQSEDCPIVLIKPDNIRTASLRPLTIKLSANDCETTTPTAQYTAAFGAFHSAILDGQFHKLVLARAEKGTVHYTGNIFSLFENACMSYPRLTIILFSTPQTGTWLIASPEILVEGMSGNYHTVALAGTMPFKEGFPEWSDKNKQEQHIVEQYIADTITPLAHDVVRDGPTTMRAGNLIHLRTDFHFHLKDTVSVGTIISHLHPTPAVCGLPKAEAREFILQHEGIDRRYYSGFSGPVDINGETHLYVSLRCAELSPSQQATGFDFYAGGGIMPNSTCLSEWQETEHKMKTIENVLQ